MKLVPPPGPGRIRALSRTLRLARETVSDLDHILSQGADPAVDQARGILSEIARIFDNALDQVQDLAHVVDSDSVHARGIVFELEHILDCAHRFNIDFARLTASFLSFEYSFQLDRTIAKARNLTFDTNLQVTRALIAADELLPAREAWKPPSKSAQQMLGTVAYILPPRERARYAREFDSELAEIAWAGGGRRTQLAYAARQLLHAWHLRAELRAPRRRGAVQ